ncbi:hypothetical protein [Halobellus inordinatus]|uniref:hypothetical protein n=1 Tax=Halobellus inordinatus TaxID=1126236 RepID=UPI00210E5D13|nr:hypothetical protein [Halobellus inordinatus]
MVTQDSYLYETGPDQKALRIGAHDDILAPTYIPEIKGAEGLRALLDHIDSLDESNPIAVPAAKWSWLRSKNEVTSRTDGDGNEVGKSEVERLEEEHPLVFFDPPELYWYKRTKTLVNYLFRLPGYDKDRFERLLREGKHSEAQAELPEFVQPFVHANVNRLLEETDGASLVSRSSLKVDSSEEAWTSLDPDHYVGYFDTIASEASKRPSSVVVPPVPQLERDWDTDLVTAWVTSNEKMLEAVDGHENTDAYFHIYLNPRSFDTDASTDTAEKALQTLEEEVTGSDYAGIALTVYYPNRIWQTNRSARMETFVEGLSKISTRESIPIIAPRSEWFGSYATDLGVHAFSTLLNGAWEYRRYSSEGGPSGANRYGSTMIPNEARALKVRSDNNEDLEGYLEANQSLPDVDGLPSTPPTYDPNGNGLKQKFGTDAEFRRTFGKPRRLAHIEEARQFRKDQQQGVSKPAREYLKDSKNPYIEI